MAPLLFDLQMLCHSLDGFPVKGVAELSLILRVVEDVLDRGRVPLSAALRVYVVVAEPLGNRSEAFPLAPELKDPLDNGCGLRVRLQLTVSVFPVAKRHFPAGVTPVFGLPLASLGGPFGDNVPPGTAGGAR